MKKQTIAVLGPGSWGTALSQVLNDNGHEVRIWGNISDQIDEINNQHTNKRYFKDILLDEKSNETGCPTSSKGAQSQGCHHACLQRIGTR